MLSFSRYCSVTVYLVLLCFSLFSCSKPTLADSFPTGSKVTTTWVANSTYLIVEWEPVAASNVAYSVSCVSSDGTKFPDLYATVASSSTKSFPYVFSATLHISVFKNYVDKSSWSLSVTAVDASKRSLRTYDIQTVTMPVSRSNISFRWPFLWYGTTSIVSIVDAYNFKTKSSSNINYRVRSSVKQPWQSELKVVRDWTSLSATVDKPTNIPTNFTDSTQNFVQVELSPTLPTSYLQSYQASTVIFDTTPKTQTDREFSAIVYIRMCSPANWYTSPTSLLNFKRSFEYEMGQYFKLYELFHDFVAVRLMTSSFPSASQISNDKGCFRVEFVVTVRPIPPATTPRMLQLYDIFHYAGDSTRARMNAWQTYLLTSTYINAALGSSHITVLRYNSLDPAPNDSEESWYLLIYCCLSASGLVFGIGFIIYNIRSRGGQDSFTHVSNEKEPNDVRVGLIVPSEDPKSV